MLALHATWVETERELTNGSDIAGEVLWAPAIIEGLAQTAAVLNGFDERSSGRTSTKGMLVGVRRVRIHRQPRSGETVRYRVDLIRRLEPLTLVQGRAFVGDLCCAEGELKFFVEDV